MKKKEYKVQILLYSGSGWTDFGDVYQLGKEFMGSYAEMIMKESKPYMVRVVERPVQADWKQCKLIKRKP